jgi:hypothetical protein
MIDPPFTVKKPTDKPFFTAILASFCNFIPLFYAFAEDSGLFLPAASHLGCQSIGRNRITPGVVFYVVSRRPFGLASLRPQGDMTGRPPGGPGDAFVAFPSCHPEDAFYASEGSR